MPDQMTLVTGANRGIGLALAARLAPLGPFIGTYRSAPPEGAAGSWLPYDVTAPDGPCTLASALDGRPIGLLVCNAGVYLDKGENLDDGYAEPLWAETFAANVAGVFLTIQALLPNLRAAQDARIAIIASRMGSNTCASGGGYIYRASKAAAINLGSNLALDLRGDGIAVGIYHPGWVQTDMGGGIADLTVDQSADGLVARFDELSLATTGRFVNYDGSELPF